MRLTRSLFVLLILLLSNCCSALVQIDINKGNVDPIPVAISRFEGDTAAARAVAEKITSVVQKDLESSGLFKIINDAAFLEEAFISKTPRFGNWRRINATVLTVGAARVIGKDIEVEFIIWDPYSEKRLDGLVYKVSLNSWRRIAHKIADRIYYNVTGDSGYFDSKVVFIAESGSLKNRVKRLAIMDQDGQNITLLTDGKYLVSTPRFDPHSQRVAYLSYKNKMPQVFILDLQTGVQKSLGKFQGMSFAPRFSPDGGAVIFSRTQDGSTSIFEMNLNSNRVKQLTVDPDCISTSPSYSAKGDQIVFNSDRSGSLQLYVMNRDGGKAERISFGEGKYMTPVWSPRGDLIAFTKLLNNTFYIGVMRKDGTGERLLTSSWFEESPTWSPNGRVIMFFRSYKDGASKLVTVDATGYNEKVVSTPGDASAPAWSPILED